jgi:hypothetical protein
MKTACFFVPLAQPYEGVNHPAAKIQPLFENTVCSIPLFSPGFLQGLQKYSLFWAISALRDMQPWD